MPRRGTNGQWVCAVSGGPDSVYLLYTEKRRGRPLVIAHFNHAARGAESDADAAFVAELGKALDIPVRVRKGKQAGHTGRKENGGPEAAPAPGFEDRARRERYAFFRDVMTRERSSKVLLAHTADDQVETVLMRILEGAGISGLKGIPRETGSGIVRPLLDTWRSEIIEYLHAHKIPYRDDRTNADTRFERNWIRHVLVPLLEKRYGKEIRKRIFALGERFREIDVFLETSAKKWLKRYVEIDFGEGGTAAREKRPRRVGIPRGGYARQPAALRKKALQLVCFDSLGTVPNERLLGAMDRLIVSGKPSGHLSVGNGWVLALRYDEAVCEKRSAGAGGRAARGGGGRDEVGAPAGPAGARFAIVGGERGRPSPDDLRRLTVGERGAIFDKAGLKLPLAVRPLLAGDRVRPLGMAAARKVKEIMIDRKIPRDDRWGRPAVCDAEGEILWIPGVVRSAAAPVTRRTKRTVVLRAVSNPGGSARGDSAE